MAFLSERMLAMPEYNTEKSTIENEIIALDNLSQLSSLSVSERDRHNAILQSLEVPDDLLL